MSRKRRIRAPRKKSRDKRIMRHADSDLNLNQNINMFMAETQGLFTERELTEADKLSGLQIVTDANTAAAKDKENRALEQCLDDDMNRLMHELAGVYNEEESRTRSDVLDAGGQKQSLEQVNAQQDDFPALRNIDYDQLMITEEEIEEDISANEEAIELQAIEEYPARSPSPMLGDKMNRAIPPQAQVIENPFDANNWMAYVNSLNKDFCEMHSYRSSRFPSEDTVTLHSGDVFAIQVPPNATKRVDCQNVDMAYYDKLRIVLEVETSYLLVCKDFHSVLFTCSPSSNPNAKPAIVRIFVIDSNQSSFPKIPLRQDQQFTLIGLSGLTFQIQLYPSTIPAEMLKSKAEKYIVPLLYSAHHKSETVCIAMNTMVQLKFFHEAVAQTYKLITITDKKVTSSEPIPFPELTAQIEPWKLDVHRMNRDLRVASILPAAKFITTEEAETEIIVQTHSIYAVQLLQKRTLKLLTPKGSPRTALVNAKVIAGLSYIIVRRTNDTWTIRCEASTQESAHAVIRVVSVANESKCTIPFRSNVPCILLARADVEYSLRVFPPEFARSLIQRLDLTFPSVELTRPLDETFLRLPLISLHRVRFIDSQRKQGRKIPFRAVMKDVTDLRGSTDEMIRTAIRKATDVKQNVSNKDLQTLSFEHGYSKREE